MQKISTSKIRIANKSTTIQSLIALCVLTISILSSCRTSNDVTVRESVFELKAEKEFFNTIQEQSFQYHTFSARMQLELVMASGKEMSSRAHLKVEKDNRLQISIQPFLGIEVFRIELTPDSIKIIDRMNKRYLLDDYNQIKGSTAIDFNFYNLQALFTNQLFLPGEANLSKNQWNRFQWKQTKTGYLLHTKDRSGLQYSFTADHEEKLCAAEIKDISSNYTLYWNYENFRPLNKHLFPMKINALLHIEKNSKNSFSFNYSRIDVDVPIEMNFSIPPGYERVSLLQILKSIEQS